MLVKPLAMSNDSGLDRLMPIITTIIISSNSTIRNPVISETSRLEDRPELMRGITIVSAENFRKNKSQINNSFFKNQGNCGRSSAIHRRQSIDLSTSTHANAPRRFPSRSGRIQDALRAPPASKSFALKRRLCARETMDVHRQSDHGANDHGCDSTFIQCI